MSQDYGPAIWMPSDHHDGWGVFKPRYVIVHGTAGDKTVEDVGATFAARGSSTHYAVGRDGRVAQYVAETSAAWGNGPITGAPCVGGDGVHHDAWWDSAPGGNPNTVTFSIEHCHAWLDNSDPPTDAQKAASFALIRHLCERWGIPKRMADAQGGVTGHFSMDPVNRARCPGTYPWDELWAYLNGNGGGGSSGGGGMWTKQADGSGMGARGNHCGQGFMAELIAKGETGVDGRMSETYVGGAQGYKSFLPLANGDVLVWDGQQVTHDAALVCADLYRLLIASQHAQGVPAPAPAPQPIPQDYQDAKAFRDSLVALPHAQGL